MVLSAEKLTILQDKLNVGSCTSNEAYETFFKQVMSPFLLNESVIVVDGVYLAIMEIEIYYTSKLHPDPFTHCDPLQSNPLQWYFHRAGSNYKGGCYKGLDITLGSSKGVGGILIRSLKNMQTGEITCGPSNSVDLLLHLSSCSSIIELVTRMGEVSVTSPTLYLCPIAFPREYPIVFSPRVGLYPTKKDVAHAIQAEYLFRDYRAIADPTAIPKGRHLMALHGIKMRHTTTQISSSIGMKETVIEGYRLLYQTALQKATPLHTFTGKITDREIFSYYGAYCASLGGTTSSTAPSLLIVNEIPLNPEYSIPLVTEKELAKLTVVVLKKKLRDAKLPVSGRKASLVARLHKHLNHLSNQTKSHSQEPIIRPENPPAFAPVKAKAAKKVAKKVVSQYPIPISDSSNVRVSDPRPFVGLDSFTISRSDKSLAQSSVSSSENSLHYAVPIVGVSDSVASLTQLREQGFISQVEYEQRSKSLSEVSILTKGIQDVSLDDDFLRVSFIECAEWTDALIGGQSTQLNILLRTKICKGISLSHDESLCYQENYERICSLFCGITAQDKQTVNLPLIVTELSRVLAHSQNENVLNDTLRAMAHIGEIDNTSRKKFIELNQNILATMAQEVISARSDKSLLFTKYLANTLVSLIRTATISLFGPRSQETLAVFSHALATSSQSVSIVRDCLRILSGLCYDLKCIEMAMNKIPYLLECVFVFLSHHCVDVVHYATVFFINISSGSDDLTSKALQLGVVDQLMMIARRCACDETEKAQDLMKEIYFCMANFAGGTLEQVTALLDRDIIGMIINQYPECTRKVQTEILWTVGNLLVAKNIPSTRFDNLDLFLLCYEMLSDPNHSDDSIGQLQKGLQTAKKILPEFCFDHPDIDALLELIAN